MDGAPLTVKTSTGDDELRRLILDPHAVEMKAIKVKSGEKLSPDDIQKLSALTRRMFVNLLRREDFRVRMPAETERTAENMKLYEHNCKLRDVRARMFLRKRTPKSHMIEKYAKVCPRSFVFDTSSQDNKRLRLVQEAAMQASAAMNSDKVDVDKKAIRSHFQKVAFTLSAMDDTASELNRAPEGDKEDAGMDDERVWEVVDRRTGDDGQPMKVIRHRETGETKVRYEATKEALRSIEQAARDISAHKDAFGQGAKTNKELEEEENRKARKRASRRKRKKAAQRRAAGKEVAETPARTAKRVAASFNTTEERGQWAMAMLEKRKTPFLAGVGFRWSRTVVGFS